MVSRKRSKGKERKAKKVEIEAEERADTRRARNECIHKMLLLHGSNDCDHGYSICERNRRVSISHPALNLVCDFIFDWNGFEITSLHDNLINTFNTHKEVWMNAAHRKVVINILMIIGTKNLMIPDVLLRTAGDPILLPAKFSYVILVFEQFDGLRCIDSVLNSRIVAAKRRDLYNDSNSFTAFSNSSRRDVLKFYSKRTSCSCLKEIHSETRSSIPKTGKCYHCKKEQDRASLMVCSRCRISHYCSRECQVANWPSHQMECDIYVCAQQYEEVSESDKKIKKQISGKERIVTENNRKLREIAEKEKGKYSAKMLREMEKVLMK